MQGNLFEPKQDATTLRAYQRVAIDSLRGHRAKGQKHLLLVLPTGAGKTLTASELIRSALEMGRRVMFVVHLRELVDQTVRAFARLGITHVGVLRGDDDRVDPEAPVQIVSIQTLARRDKPEAQIIILDEAHRSLADSYVKHIWDAYPEAVIIGLTASPCLGDGRPLGRRYEALIVGAKYSELIAQKYVADPIVFAPRVEPDLSNVRKVGGDWDDGEVERVMTQIVGDIVPTWKAHAKHESGLWRRTICFASGILHSKDIVRRFVEAGIAAEHLDGMTASGEREAILARLAAGTTTIVSNCGVLTEGFDMPSIRCAIIARPTLSLVLHMQTAGRATRAGADRPIILDHAGNVGRHGMPHEDRVWSLTGPAKRDAKKNPYKICKKCFAYIKAGATKCPHCGFAQPAMPRELPTEVSGRDLERVGSPELERDFYQSCVNLARSRGFKPGMASFKFKEKFGRWPPWAWSQETKAQFAGDEHWQARQEHRAREREHWQEADRQAAEKLASDDSKYSKPDEHEPETDRERYINDEVPSDYYDDIPF